MKAVRLDRSLIAGFDMFRAMPAADLDQILAAAHTRRLLPDDTAFEQGAPAAEFFVLLSGRLKVQHTTPEGQQVVVRHVGPGEIFGIARALGRTDYPATAIAVVESLALAWPQSEWDDLIARNPAFAAGTMQTIGRRLQDADRRVRELSTEEAERRVAHAVLRLASQAGRKTETGIEIDFPVTREDIAEMTGTTLHTVSRIMSGWQQSGLVSSQRRRITLVDAAGLQRVAEAQQAG